MAAYIADQKSWSQESSRLDSLESALDRTTIRYLKQLGLGRGMRCLEIGAGAGSVARWMAEQVGDAGLVVATDLDISLLAPLAAGSPQLEARSEDISRTSPRAPDGGLFDLAHARLVLGHVSDAPGALHNIVRAVRPGGWIVIEDVDFLWTDVGVQPIHPQALMRPYFYVWTAVVAFMQENGYAVHWGRQLASALRDAGLAQVAGEAVMTIGDASLQRAMRLTIERFAVSLVATGHLTSGEVEACLGALDEPTLVFTGSPMFSVWGRRPAHD